MNVFLDYFCACSITDWNIVRFRLFQDSYLLVLNEFFSFVYYFFYIFLLFYFDFNLFMPFD
jgi:hypothetical protein